MRKAGAAGGLSLLLLYLAQGGDGQGGLPPELGRGALVIFTRIILAVQKI